MWNQMRDLVLKIAWHYLGRPYIWGGDSPEGFDCSGLAIECLKSIGVLPRKGDWTAEGLFQLCKAVSTPEPGDLVFWADESGKHIHVEIYQGNGLSIGASGGGSWAVDAKEAYRKGAYVKVRPVATRGGTVHYGDPYPSTS